MAPISYIYILINTMGTECLYDNLKFKLHTTCAAPLDLPVKWWWSITLISLQLLRNFFLKTFAVLSRFLCFLKKINILSFHSLPIFSQIFNLTQFCQNDRYVFESLSIVRWFFPKCFRFFKPIPVYNLPMILLFPLKSALYLNVRRFFFLKLLQVRNGLVIDHKDFWCLLLFCSLCSYYIFSLHLLLL